MEYFIGVDIGGIFTDAVVWNKRGDLWLDKAFTTSPHFERGVIAALGNCAPETHQALLGQVLSQAECFGHGTTVGTNALIERKGSDVALITTHGFEDTTVIMRGSMGRVLGLPRERAMDFIHTECPSPLPPEETDFRCDGTS